MMANDPDDGKQIPAHTAHHRFDQSEHGVGGDRRIDGGATLSENVDGGLRGQRVAHRRQAVPGDDFRSRGKSSPYRTVRGFGDVKESQIAEETEQQLDKAMQSETMSTHC